MHWYMGMPENGIPQNRMGYLYSPHCIIKSSCIGGMHHFQTHPYIVHTYIHTYVHTYIHTYIIYIALHYITSHKITYIIYIYVYVYVYAYIYIYVYVYVYILSYNISCWLPSYIIIKSHDSSAPLISSPPSCVEPDSAVLSRIT